MRLVKKFERDDVTQLVSGIFNEVLVRIDYPLPFTVFEFHIRDRDMTSIEGDRAVVCIDYNNPLVLEKDARAIRTIIRREFVRLLLNENLPRIVEDVLVDRKMIKNGFGDDLFYLYYNTLMKKNFPASLDGYIELNIPWVVFRGNDNYNSSFLKDLADKRCTKKYPSARRLFNLLCHEKTAEASKELASLRGE